MCTHSALTMYSLQAASPSKSSSSSPTPCAARGNGAAAASNYLPTTNYPPTPRGPLPLGVPGSGRVPRDGTARAHSVWGRGSMMRIEGRRGPCAWGPNRVVTVLTWDYRVAREGVAGSLRGRHPLRVVKGQKHRAPGGDPACPPKLVLSLRLEVWGNMIMPRSRMPPQGSS